MDEHNDDRLPTTVRRRTMLRGLVAGGTVVAGGSLLAACGDDTTSGTGTSTTPTPEQSSEPAAGGGASESASSDVLVLTADVPEGGGVILDAEKVVVTQPTAGEFVAFSAICTHQGCPVEDIAQGVIICPCHGSQFSIEDGSVVAGPAPSPLPEVAVSVKGKSVVRD